MTPVALLPKHTLNLGGSKCPTIALSESLDMSPPMHQDSRKNRGKNAPPWNFLSNQFLRGKWKNRKNSHVAKFYMLQLHHFLLKEKWYLQKSYEKQKLERFIFHMVETALFYLNPFKNDSHSNATIFFLVFGLNLDTAHHNYRGVKGHWPSPSPLLLGSTHPK